MTRLTELIARQAKIAELKRLITSSSFESQQMLEDAVDAFMWSEHVDPPRRPNEQRQGAIAELPS